MLSKARSETLLASNKGTLKYLRGQLKIIEARFGKKSIRFRTVIRPDVWSIKQSNTIVFGISFLKTRKLALLAMIHELGHLYTHGSRNKVTLEVNANLWALQCIETLYDSDIKLKKLFREYLTMCLNSEPGEHSEGAFELITTIGGQVLKTTKNTLMIDLPHKYKDW